MGVTLADSLELVLVVRGWLSVGMEDTRAMDYDVYSHMTVGMDIRGGCMSKMSVARFQQMTDCGHYRSKADMEEAPNATLSVLINLHSLSLPRPRASLARTTAWAW